MRQQHILLRLVEAVQLIDKENRALPAQSHARAGLGDLLAYLAHVALHAVERHKDRTGAARNHEGQRRLPHAGRPVKNERGKAIRLNRAAQQLAGCEQVLLPGHLIERLGAHARRQRHGRQRRQTRCILLGAPGLAAFGVIVQRK